MKRLNKKTAAFTISEMLVVLVISGIVISLALVVLNLVQQQMRSINRHQEAQAEIRLLERTLWQDFNKHKVFLNQQYVYCISVNDTVTYTFNQHFTLRNRDTISVPVNNVKYYLDGNPVKSNSLIDGLELQVSKEQSDKLIFIYKTKDAAHYMNDGI